MKKVFYGIKEMTNYAAKYYNFKLNTKNKHAIKMKLCRYLKENQLVEKEENDRYKYEIDESLAKKHIKTGLFQYFYNKFASENFKRRYKYITDSDQNNENAFETYAERKEKEIEILMNILEENADYPIPPLFPISNEINVSVLNLMIKMVFYKHFPYFDEYEYRENLCELYNMQLIKDDVELTTPRELELKDDLINPKRYYIYDYYIPNDIKELKDLLTQIKLVLNSEDKELVLIIKKMLSRLENKKLIQKSKLSHVLKSSKKILSEKEDDTTKNEMINKITNISKTIPKDTIQKDKIEDILEEVRDGKNLLFNPVSNTLE